MKRLKTQTSLPRGTFSHGDKHPVYPDRLFLDYEKGDRERWTSVEKFLKAKLRKQSYWTENKETLNAFQRQYYKCNKNKAKQRQKEYYQSHKEDFQLRYQSRRANMESNLNESDARLIKLFYRFASMLNSIHKNSIFHVDHIIPISKGGKHSPCNLAIATRKFNLWKFNYTDRGPEQFLNLTK